MRPVRRSLFPVVLAVLVLVGLTACGDAEGTNEGGYISGNGQVVQYAPDDRGDPVELSGDTLEGKPLDVADFRGEPVVINVWWSECGPCREEMPMLEKSHEKLGESVAFMGINTRDSSPEQGLAFQRHYGVEYPSIYSADGGAIRSLADYVAPRTIPATAVLDEKGRVAAVVRGPIPSQTTLEEIIEDARVSPDGGGDGA